MMSPMQRLNRWLWIDLSGQWTEPFRDPIDPLTPYIAGHAAAVRTLALRSRTPRGLLEPLEPVGAVERDYEQATRHVRQARASRLQQLQRLRADGNAG